MMGLEKLKAEKSIFILFFCAFLNLAIWFALISNRSLPRLIGDLLEFGLGSTAVLLLLWVFYYSRRLVKSNAYVNTSTKFIYYAMLTCVVLGCVPLLYLLVFVVFLW
jgi:hypothetical protein